jgi:hypothetical protein
MPHMRLILAAFTVLGLIMQVTVGAPVPYVHVYGEC